jgi:hypothetical protein
MRTRIEFDSVKEAVDHAKMQGGWIAVGEKVHWYSGYTWSEIILDIKGNALIGGYSWIERRTSNVSAAVPV